MANHKNEQDFISSVIGTDLLDNAVDWIASNYLPDDVFAKKDLEAWAEANGYTKE